MTFFDQGIIMAGRIRGREGIVLFTAAHFVWLGRRAYGRNLLILFCLAAVAIYLNGAFFAYGTNFMFLTRPPLEGLPILNLNHGWYGYALTLAILALVLMTLVHLPFLVAEHKKAAPVGKNFQ